MVRCKVQQGFDPELRIKKTHLLSQILGIV